LDCLVIYYTPSVRREREARRMARKLRSHAIDAHHGNKVAPHNSGRGSPGGGQGGMKGSPLTLPTTLLIHGPGTPPSPQPRGGSGANTPIRSARIAAGHRASADGSHGLAWPKPNHVNGIGREFEDHLHLPHPIAATADAPVTATSAPVVTTTTIVADVLPSTELGSPLLPSHLNQSLLPVAQPQQLTEPSTATPNTTTIVGGGAAPIAGTDASLPPSSVVVDSTIRFPLPTNETRSITIRA
jgi:hypothetical protein